MTADAPAADQRPAMPAAVAELYDTWLIPNGIVGGLPEGATITVDHTAGTVTWPQWQHLDPNSGPWDHDVRVASDSWTAEQRAARRDDPAGDQPDTIDQTVPLAAPVTDRVRELFRHGGLNLVERNG